jgi:lysophospholipase L1-like esterase
VRRLLANLGLAIATSSLAVAAGEAALRSRVSLPLKRVAPEVRYDPHPVRRWTLRPNQQAFTYGAAATIDARGFRTNGPGAPRDGPLTILALGDSFTFGLGVRDEETWPARLEVALARHGVPGAVVVNGGTIAYGVAQELDHFLEKGLATRPDLVIHALYWNDFLDAEPPPPDAAVVVTEDGWLEWEVEAATGNAVRRTISRATNRSALLFSLKQVGARLLRQGSRDDWYGNFYYRMLAEGLDEDQWTPIETFYRDLQELAAQHQFGIHVVLMPVSDIVRQPEAAGHAYPTQARERLARMGIPYLDVFQLWEQEGFRLRHFLPEPRDAHLDAHGYRIVADALAEALLAHPETGHILSPIRTGAAEPPPSDVGTQ